MGLHRRAVDDPQLGAGAISGGCRWHRGSLQPVDPPAGGHGGRLHRGTHRRVARWREHAYWFHRPVGREATHTEGRGNRQQVGGLGRTHTRLRLGRRRADPGGAPLGGRRHATDLVAACSQQCSLRSHLLCDRAARPQPSREPLSHPALQHRRRLVQPSAFDPKRTFLLFPPCSILNFENHLEPCCGSLQKLPLQPLYRLTWQVGSGRG